MKRARQCILFLVILMLCGCLWFRSNRLYFSPEAAFYGAERGLRYGPSEEILLTYPRGDGSEIYVGKWNRGFSVIPVEPYLGLFWRMSTDVSVEGYHFMDGDVDAMLTEENVLVGLSCLPEVAEVTCLFYSMADEMENLTPVQEITLPVGENGFFHEKMDFPQANPGMFYVGYIEGRTETGEVVYRKGLDKDGKEYDTEGHLPRVSSVGGWADENIQDRKARP
ncbi:hypothetical protein [Anaerotignum sp.]|uniref:hypothetical protein n=1 Tax=Anaerotignum sp. TaxID=2039241 RepID=UPI002A914FE9|nr:hypothetical protein [Anaerotignum sp.]MCI7656371.1 hypothetical protein [Clostridia bacterium]MDY5414396.1 hypothetical protein [Anaerotignum sp.]